MSSTVLTNVSPHTLAARAGSYMSSWFTWRKVVSWRTAAVLFALLNLKCLPFAWHLRLFYIMFAHGRNVPKIKRFILQSSRTDDDVHPLFKSQTITCRVPLMDMDYNLHKSNSTYFADLDHSRAALVTSLFAPALGLNTLWDHGVKGPLYPILGATHTSFLREIKPRETYEVRSRLLGWDRKWIVIASYFVRRPNAKDKRRARREGKTLKDSDEVLLACTLSKYVVKSGRKTIPPELCLAASGWFRVRPGLVESVIRSKPFSARKSSDSGSDIMTGSNSPNSVPEPNSTSIRAREMAKGVAGALNRRLSSADPEDLTTMSLSPSASTVLVDAIPENEPASGVELEIGGWTWDQIDTERARGMRVAQEWLSLDSYLKTEYELGW